MLVKQAFPNGLVYKYSPHRMSIQLRGRGLNLSPHKIRRLVRKWKNLSWICFVGDCLTFTSNKDRSCISVEKSQLRQTIRDLLVLQNLRQQQFAVNTKRNLKYPRGRSAYSDHKKAKQNVKKLSGDTERFNIDLMLSAKKVGELLGVSTSTGARTMQGLVSRGVLLAGTPKYYRRTDYGYLKKRPISYALNIPLWVVLF